MARGVTTEWEDIHVAKGNWKAREHVPTSEDIFDAQQETVQGYDNWKLLNTKQIDEMVEDDFDLEDDDMLKAYREQRMAEMAVAAAKPRFGGGVFELTK